LRWRLYWGKGIEHGHFSRGRGECETRPRRKPIEAAAGSFRLFLYLCTIDVRRRRCRIHFANEANRYFDRAGQDEYALGRPARAHLTGFFSNFLKLSSFHFTRGWGLCFCAKSKTHMAQNATSSGRNAILTMAVAVFCFYIGDNQTKLASGYLVVTQVLLLRTLIGLAILGAVYWWRQPKLNLDVYKDVFLLLQGVALLATIISFAISFHYSKDMTPIYVISFLWPGFLMLFERLMGAKIRKSTIILTPIMYVGVIVFFLTPLRFSFDSFLTLAMMPAYCTAVGYAAFLAFSSRTRSESHQIDKTFAIYSIAAVGLFAISAIQILRDPLLPAFDWTIARAIGLAGIASFLGVVLLLQAAAMQTAVDIAAIDFTVVIWAYFNDTVLGSEAFDAFQMLGVVIIVLGAIAMMVFSRSRI
jgi:drug/metabolite transporter (DMT)-like permease